MKILIIQLARLGDIYMSWPTVRALKRMYPDSHIDLLVRSRFKGATIGLNEADRVLELNTQHILESLFEDKANLDPALEKLSEVKNTLRMQKYDKIVNLTFSPFSSYLCHAISHETTQVTGYTRHEDGYLSIPDDGSSYFYAQVGLNRFNRLHVTDLFSNVAGVDLVAADFAPPPEASEIQLPSENFIVIHVGASQKFKMIESHKWSQIINQLKVQHPDKHFILIGSQDEYAYAQSIESSVSQVQIHNWVGKTNLHDIFKLLSKAKLLVGCDSAPMHMATLANCPSFCVSFQAVNFWETGPRSDKSYVAFFARAEDVETTLVAEQIHNVLIGSPLSDEIFQYTGGYPCYTRVKKHDCFEWGLIQALYLGGELPVLESAIQLEGFRRLREVNSVIHEQIENIRQTGETKAISGLIQRADEIVDVIGKLVPDISPLIRWYQTEKIRIPPLQLSQIMDETEKIHQQLEVWLSAYLGPGLISVKELQGSLQHYANLIHKTQQQILMLVAELRFSGIQLAFEQLSKVIDLNMSLVNGLKDIKYSLADTLSHFDVDQWQQYESQLHQVIHDIAAHMERNDYNVVADSLEHELISSLDGWVELLKQNEQSLNIYLQQQIQGTHGVGG